MLKREDKEYSRRPGERYGFTLIELLVVIGIIALLAAILFPVFARSRENARRASCASNLKQIGLALAQYKNDEGNSMPFFSYTVTGYTHSDPNIYAANQNLFTWIDAVLPYTKNTQIFKCPSEPKTKFTDGTALDWRQAYYYFQTGYNNWGGLFNAIPYESIAKPSETIWGCGDTKYNQCNGGTWGMGPDVDQRHLGTANFLFYDWHVKAMRIDQTSQGPYNQGSFSANTGYTSSMWDNDRTK
jgi:prepilin-type N-terminal cleavage/methylation domain-containing protein/prepilin-type processing-associated H-X9-DG protein